jgi:hypothetical protein
MWRLEQGGFDGVAEVDPFSWAKVTLLEDSWCPSFTFPSVDQLYIDGEPPFPSFLTFLGPPFPDQFKRSVRVSFVFFCLRFLDLCTTTPRANQLHHAVVFSDGCDLRRLRQPGEGAR